MRFGIIHEINLLPFCPHVGSPCIPSVRPASDVLFQVIKTKPQIPGVDMVNHNCSVAKVSLQILLCKGITTD